ncbi:MAG: ribosomal protein L11 methyltransferase [Coxiella sp. RIFCSPHIGHO2_12_FULL_44_14]|nr:MAG: ribosomal protein L11 methyltransferase [Coxiella sp. RIFCSPHIGHO2_12_FULL_44_14]
MTVWQQLEITTHANYAEEIADLLNEHGALSVSFNDAGNQALFQLTPDDTPLWSQTKITALFLQTVNIELILQHIKQSTSHTMMDYQISTLQDQDWVRQTQQNFPPQCFSEILWVIPSWCNSNHYGNHTIKIDPGLAFGTGTHPTTALCLEWLAQHPPRDMTVIDFGCGSGILSLAALAMGAKEVYAIDHDPQALQATKNNAELNPFAKNKLHTLTMEAMPKIQVPLIIANILSQPLIQLADDFNTWTQQPATLVLSGILAPEINAIAKAYSPHFSLLSARNKEEWMQLTLMKIKTPSV